MISRLARFVIVGIVLLLILSVVGYFWFRAPTRSLPSPADVNAIYQVVGAFGARLKNIPAYPLHDLEEMAAKQGIGVRTVNGIKVFHTKDDGDLAMSTTSDGSECVLTHGESLSLKSALEWQLDLPVTSEIHPNPEDHSAQYLSTAQAVDANLRELITDRLYRVFLQDPSRIPARSGCGEWPDSIRVDAVQKIDDALYSVSAGIIFSTSVQTARSHETTWKKSVTLTLKKVNGTWLIDNVTTGWANAAESMTNTYIGGSAA